MSEKCDIAMGKPGSGVRTLKWLATHWLCALSELFFFLNLRVFTVKMGSIYAKPPGCLQGCREMMHINPSRVSRGMQWWMHGPVPANTPCRCSGALGSVAKHPSGGLTVELG